MRPVRLTIEGLACFKDKVEIDLSSLNLFAISGPTGAGKSTLLDSIIFALFGEVPRVKKDDRPQMISASRDRASVVLEFEVGQCRYRITRKLRRSGSQSVQLERHDGTDFNESLADQVRRAQEKVEEILGLDASAFMQSVILPQGEFARFLEAPPRERRSMLRTLLRLDVFERMRERAKQIAIDRKSAVDSLRNVLAREYSDVSEGILARLEMQNEVGARALRGLREHRDNAQGLLDKLRIQHSKTSELTGCEARHLEIQSRVSEIETISGRLDAARRAAPLIAFIEAAAESSQEAMATAAEVELAQTEADNARREHDENKSALETVQAALRAVPSMRERIGLLNQVVGLMPGLAQMKISIAQTEANLGRLKNELAENQERAAAARRSKAKHEESRERVKRELDSIEYDAELDALLEHNRSAAFDLGHKRSQLAERKKQLSSKRATLNTLESLFGSLERQQEVTQTALDRARADVRAKDDALREAHRLDAANLLREKIRPGQPCPVCEQTVISPLAAALTPEVEAAREALAAAQSIVDKKESEFTKVQEDVLLARSKRSNERATFDSLTTDHARLEKQIAEVQESLREALHSIALADDINADEWISEKAKLFAGTRGSYAKAQEKIAKAENDIERATVDESFALITASEKEMSRVTCEEKLESSRQELECLQEKIAAVTDSGDPAGEVTRLEEQIDELDRTAIAARATISACQERLSACEADLKVKNAAAERARDQAILRAKSRDDEIAQAQFANASQVRSALLDRATMDELNTQVQDHTTDSRVLDQRISALKGELGNVRVSTVDLHEAEQLSMEINGQLEVKQGEQRDLEAQIRQMKQRIEQLVERRAKLQSEERLFRIHDRLATDLRSDKFQAYILEEAFTKLVGGASVRLLSLTSERYSLRFEEGEILVVDNDNAGESRSSSTLSGGETFLASLSLALELSSEVQRSAGAVKLDSLFIDEGFGTLDPDTLSLVSETIQSLQAGGRMVGIITHLPDLRDEFEQQIIVTKHQGYSTVEVRGVADVHTAGAAA